MTRRTIVLVVLASVLLAGCANLQGTGTPTAETPAEDPTGVEINEIPGVSNGTLTDAETLVAANRAALAETGGEINMIYDGPDVNSESVLTVGSDGASVLSITTSDGPSQFQALDSYTNDTASYLRMQSNNETRYRVVDEEVDAFNRFNSSLKYYLAAGEFTVANESADPTTVVFTAENTSGLDDGGFLDDASSVSGRLVLNQSGQIQNLTVTGQQRNETVTFTYELLQSGVEEASVPGWVSDIPPGAALEPELSIDIENNSYLRIENDGGDAVPRNATLAFSANNTNGTVTFDSPLNPGETRYAYFAASNGSLVLMTEQPAADATATLNSPASVTISTGDATLLSAGMAWDSESASEGAAGGSSDGGSDQ